LRRRLETFAQERGFGRKGPLSVALVVTKHAQEKGLPLDAGQLLTKGGGQVLGLGKAAVQAILAKYGIHRVLAEEGGRTSRGSIGKMQEYVAFLNELSEQGDVDLELVMRFWIERVLDYFAEGPFKIKLDPALGLRALVRDVVRQARERQKAGGGAAYAGAVLQHLVGAKLDCALGEGRVQHNRFSAADASTGRAGDFCVQDVVFHVTTSPGEALIAKCRENIETGYRPVIVTMEDKSSTAEDLAEAAGLEGRIDVFGIEQFIALNLYELGLRRSDGEGRRTAIQDFVHRYNEIVERIEGDRSLKIGFQR
jgi:hypothetical protein